VGEDSCACVMVSTMERLCAVDVTYEISLLVCLTRRLRGEIVLILGPGTVQTE
jgi:hypothetical protein